MQPWLHPDGGNRSPLKRRAFARGRPRGAIVDPSDGYVGFRAARTL